MTSCISHLSKVKSVFGKFAGSTVLKPFRLLVFTVTCAMYRSVLLSACCKYMSLNAFLRLH